MQAFGTRAIDDDIGDGEDLEQQAHAFVLVGRGAEQTLGVEDERVGARVVGAPHAHRARLLLIGRAEYGPTVEECVIECVRFAVARIAEYRHTLD